MDFANFECTKLLAVPILAKNEKNSKLSDVVVCKCNQATWSQNFGIRQVQYLSVVTTFHNGKWIKCTLVFQHDYKNLTGY